ncbi:MAG: glycosyltransferase family 39 protein [Crocosphaera sp.]
MNPKTFTWHPLKSLHPRGETWRIVWCWVGLLGAALILFGFNLDSSPLLESERVMAQLAQEMSENRFLSGDWLFPTLDETPYHQHPVLGLLSLTIAGYGGEFTPGSLRLVGALFAAVSVPLLYAVAREIFVLWRPAFFTALIYLTLFPVVRWGRLATLDGIVLFWSILTVLCVLRSRRDFRWSLGVGLSLSGLFLTQGLIAVLLTVLLITFVAWDTPRLLSSIYFWVGIFLGILPALTWYWMQWLMYGNTFLNSLFFHSLQTGWGNFFSSLSYYPVAVIKYSWPWLIFGIYGAKLAWKSVNWGWGKLILVWGGVYGGIICLLPLDSMSYLLPFYPCLALAGGIMLSEVNNLPGDLPYPQSWSWTLLSLSGLISLISLCIMLNFPWYFPLPSHRFLLVLTLIALAFTWSVTAALIRRRNSQFIAVLFWGMYVSLTLVISSPYWVGNNIYF